MHKVEQAFLPRASTVLASQVWDEEKIVDWEE
jgi:hypothetical protein